eukprot:1182325-Prorocentrum_minimum.AAC.3
MRDRVSNRLTTAGRVQQEVIAMTDEQAAGFSGRYWTTCQLGRRQVVQLFPTRTCRSAPPRGAPRAARCLRHALEHVLTYGIPITSSIQSVFPLVFGTAGARVRKTGGMCVSKCATQRKSGKTNGTGGAPPHNQWRAPLPRGQRATLVYIGIPWYPLKVYPPGGAPRRARTSAARA